MGPWESQAIMLLSISFLSFSFTSLPLFPPLPLGLPWRACPGGAGGGAAPLLLTLPDLTLSTPPVRLSTLLLSSLSPLSSPQSFLLSLFPPLGISLTLNADPLVFDP